MLLTPHTMVGIAIGAGIPNAFVAVPLSFLMHFAGDLVPHWDPFDEFPSETKAWMGWKALLVQLDLIVGVTLGVFFTLYALWVNNDPHLALNIFLCGIAAVLPDVMYLPIVFLKSKNIIFKLNHEIQKKIHNKAGIVWGNISQWSVTLLAFLMTLSSLVR